jgi:hypothetical protein
VLMRIHMPRISAKPFDTRVITVRRRRANRAKWKRTGQPKREVTGRHDGGLRIP